MHTGSNREGEGSIRQEDEFREPLQSSFPPPSAVAVQIDAAESDPEAEVQDMCA